MTQVTNSTVQLFMVTFSNGIYDLNIDISKVRTPQTDVNMHNSLLKVQHNTGNF